MTKVLSKKALVSLVVIMTMIFMVACSSKKTNTAASPGATDASAPTPMAKVKIKGLIHTSWDKAGIEAVMKEAADKVGVELELDKVAEGDDGDKVILTRFATNELPDLLFFYTGEANLGKLGKPQDYLVDQTGQPWLQNFDQVAWKGAMDYQGKFYGAPYQGANLGVMLYNKKVFANLSIQPPTTYTEFLAAADKIKTAGKVPVYISGKDAWTLQLLPFGTGSKPGNIDFYTKVNENKAKITDDKDVTRGMDILLELKSKGLINPTFLSDTYDNAEKAIANGDAGMYPMATWVMDDIVKKFPDQANDIGSFIMPTDDSGKNTAGLFAPSMLYVVKGKNQEAAQRFVNYFASLEGQNAYFAVEGGIPAMKGVTKTMLTPAALDAQKFADSGNAVPVWGTGLKYAFGDFSSLLQDLMAGGKNPDQVTQAMQKEFEKNAKAKDDANFK